MVGHVSLYQLPANACIAACRVASFIRASAFGPRDPRKPASTSRVSPFTWLAGRQRFPGHKAQPVDACKHASPKVFGHESGSDR
jgi:hypothetical protein